MASHRRKRHHNGMRVKAFALTATRREIAGPTPSGAEMQDAPHLAVRIFFSAGRGINLNRDPALCFRHGTLATSGREQRCRVVGPDLDRGPMPTIP